MIPQPKCSNLIGGGLLDLVPGVEVVVVRLQAHQVIVEVFAAHGPAVLQSLLPGLVLLHQDQVVRHTDEREGTRATDTVPLVIFNGNEATLLIVMVVGLPRCPVCVT